MGKKANFINLETTLVFDSTYQPGWASSKVDGVFEVIYTNEGETADDWLIRFVKNMGDRDQVTIVTSDNRLRVHLQRKGVMIISSEEFMRLMNGRVKSSIRSLRQIPASERKTELPTKKVAKGSVDYYEKLFLERLGEEAPTEEEEEKEAFRPLKKEKKLSGESDQDRWERLFSDKDR